MEPIRSHKCVSILGGIIGFITCYLSYINIVYIYIHYCIILLYSHLALNFQHITRFSSKWTCAVAAHFDLQLGHQELFQPPDLGSTLDQATQVSQGPKVSQVLLPSSGGDILNLGLNGYPYNWMVNTKDKLRSVVPWVLKLWPFPMCTHHATTFNFLQVASRTNYLTFSSRCCRCCHCSHCCHHCSTCSTRWNSLPSSGVGASFFPVFLGGITR